MGFMTTNVRRRLLRRIFRTPARCAVGSFAAAILLGTLLLCLPWSSSTREWTKPADAFFTATSSVCVTGLIVVGTPDHWSLFGQLIILAMIQAGGLGLMTMGAFLFTMLQRRFSIGFERMLGDVVETDPEENVWVMVKFICLLALLAEVVGTVCLFVSWQERFPSFWTCLYQSAFHSISAFCNAGFSLNNSSLVEFRNNVPVNVVICTLIVTGGLGFLVVRDLKQYLGWWLVSRKGRRPRLSTHAKLVLTVTGTLLVIGFVVVFVVESATSLHSASLRERILASIFQAVTPRTAGFNTMELSPATLAPSTALLLIALMFVGGSPGGTAGGIKTSTLGVMIASIVATLRGSDRAEMFHHSVRQETVHRVASIILLSVSALVLGTFLLLLTENSAGRSVGFLEAAFETTSAFGTVGLSLGLTKTLTFWGKLILPVLMFVGRLGPITIMMSATQLEGRAPYRYPEGHIIVG